MNHTPDRSTSDLWARFRFSVVGSLLSSPPARGELKAAIAAEAFEEAAGLRDQIRALEAKKPAAAE